ncbi:MAG: hypothetical protein R6X02_05675 [Enhygromyxa sp.]
MYGSLYNIPSPFTPFNPFGQQAYMQGSPFVPTIPGMMPGMNNGWASVGQVPGQFGQPMQGIPGAGLFGAQIPGLGPIAHAMQGAGPWGGQFGQQSPGQYGQFGQQSPGQYGQFGQYGPYGQIPGQIPGQYGQWGQQGQQVPSQFYQQIPGLGQIGHFGAQPNMFGLPFNPQDIPGLGQLFGMGQGMGLPGLGQLLGGMGSPLLTIYTLGVSFVIPNVNQLAQMRQLVDPITRLGPAGMPGQAFVQNFPPGVGQTFGQNYSPLGRTPWTGAWPVRVYIETPQGLIPLGAFV